MNLEPAIDKVKKLIIDNGGKIVSELADGKKRLAYSISGQDFAIYYYFILELPSAAPAKISSQLNISTEVIRHLLVTVDERKARYEAKLKARAEKDADKKESANESDAEEK